MSQQQSSQDKSEKPSPQKLRKAKREGQVARSKEFVVGVLFITIALFLWAYGYFLAEQAEKLFTINYQLSAAELREPDIMARKLGESVLLLAGIFVPMAMVLLIMTVLASMVPGGWVMSLKPIQPKLSKISPLAGLKRLFSIKSLVELVKSILKITLISIVLYVLLDNNLGTLIAAQRAPFEQGMGITLSHIIKALIYFGIVVLLIGLIDMPYQLWSHIKELKMTKQEVKEEHKNSEGRPEVKQRIRQIQQQMSRRRIDNSVPTADVILTNPTHYAVALKYDLSRAGAPFVVAKGEDEMAFRIKAIAEQHNIEVMNLPPLTRAIYFNTRVDQEIPGPLFVAVAHVLTYVMQLKAYKEGKNDKPQPLPSFAIPKQLLTQKPQ
ncbi:flagellar biosynthesis protein FlhB [Photobacterium sp. DA100]|uniref:flagellar biosynthesis protein FlhB n=1 Tax=Photobacterium sp. DA100 TaxID=3027472 RepID=UPI002478AE91|nr:flagellar biosynthesis protein FlhB [Photobacterium sp. DA100]WEM42976.1 flagellar biosynthesis protein FlhB [Photobacterium sp. DA100]